MTKPELKSLLKKETGGCTIQHDGWPCGTCFGAILPDNLTDEKKQAFWSTLLAYRGDYSLEQVELTKQSFKENLKELKELLVSGDK